nr:MAG TPA: hypothetical protein [Caudoviricetes sp.]
MDCIQRKIVVRPCPTTISFYTEGFYDDHFAVTLKPLCGERGSFSRTITNYQIVSIYCNIVVYAKC